jgi:hypothetical protein
MELLDSTGIVDPKQRSFASFLFDRDWSMEVAVVVVGGVGFTPW